MSKRIRKTFRPDPELDARLLAAGTMGDDTYLGVLSRLGIPEKVAYMRGRWLRRQNRDYIQVVGTLASNLLNSMLTDLPITDVIPDVEKV